MPPTLKWVDWYNTMRYTSPSEIFTAPMVTASRIDSSKSPMNTTIISPSKAWRRLMWDCMDGLQKTW